jgi:hypothetical protein
MSAVWWLLGALLLGELTLAYYLFLLYGRVAYAASVIVALSKGQSAIADGLKNWRTGL